MKKAAIWGAAVSAVVLITAWGVMGLKIFDGEYDILPLVYTGLAAWVVLLGCLIVLRWRSFKCPHCGKVWWKNGRYCSYCGKEI